MHAPRGRAPVSPSQLYSQTWEQSQPLLLSIDATAALCHSRSTLLSSAAKAPSTSSAHSSQPMLFTSFTQQSTCTQLSSPHSTQAAATAAVSAVGTSAAGSLATTTATAQPHHPPASTAAATTTSATAANYHSSGGSSSRAMLVPVTSPLIPAARASAAGQQAINGMNGTAAPAYNYDTLVAHLKVCRSDYHSVTFDPS